MDQNSKVDLNPKVDQNTNMDQNYKMDQNKKWTKMKNGPFLAFSMNFCQIKIAHNVGNETFSVIFKHRA